MERGKSRKKKGAVINWKLPTILLVVVGVLAVGALAGYGYSRFLTEKQLTGSVYYEKKLADSFQLWEHEAAADPTGAGDYTLGASTVSANEYYLTPGTTIPKDPFIVISGKTEIPAFLYVEVVEGERPALMETNVYGESIPTEAATGDVSYQLTADWVEIECPGYHGGKVYVYKGADIENALAGSTADGTYRILADDQVTVDTHRPTAGWTLDFYGYLLQTQGSVDAVQVYGEHISSQIPAPTGN